MSMPITKKASSGRRSRPRLRRVRLLSSPDTSTEVALLRVLQHPLNVPTLQYGRELSQPPEILERREKSWPHAVRSHLREAHAALRAERERADALEDEREKAKGIIQAAECEGEYLGMLTDLVQEALLGEERGVALEAAQSENRRLRTESEHNALAADDLEAAREADRRLLERCRSVLIAETESVRAADLLDDLDARLGSEEKP